MFLLETGAFFSVWQLHRERPVGFEGFGKTFFLLRKTFFYAKKADSWKGGSNLRKFGCFSSCRFSRKILFFFFTITPPFLENPLRAAIICKCLLRSFTFPVCRRGEWESWLVFPFLFFFVFFCFFLFFFVFFVFFFGKKLMQMIRQYMCKKKVGGGGGDGGRGALCFITFYMYIKVDIWWKCFYFFYIF